MMSVIQQSLAFALICLAIYVDGAQAITIHTTTEQVTIALCGVGIICGLLYCYLGYRLLRFTFLLLGFALGSGITYAILYHHTDITNKLILYIIPVVAGLVIGVLSTVLLHAGFMFLGLAFGFILVVEIYSTKTGGLIPHTIPYYILLAVLPFLGAVFTVTLKRPIAIIATSFVGAYAVMASVDRFADGGFAYVIEHVLADHPERISAPLQTYIVLAAAVILFLTGVWVQFNVTGKEKVKRQVPEEERSPLLSINATDPWQK